ncbi:sodium- and chloride-dependent neutral and basic amino acid transporter B(0+)-like [Haliotis rubra]|uniref:sodium- and chloride-dependent neutral and basic amino acid transporter B(0+)-like n=1 Tax=Haliotis rubra TaxID=36100 RepID=UPI001EE5F61C|nr:sodium- and chloride-dependent neutral and basic amino acid transporter B(0+)-like [Haliotis rubra]
MSNMASFNGIHNNCYRDALAIIVVNCLASLFVGFIIFMFLGNMANETQLPVSDVVKGGPGLAIMVYSKAVSTMPGSQLCSAIFFLSLFIIGLEGQIIHVHTAFMAMNDAFPKSLRGLELPITAVLCCAGLMLGYSCVTQGGIYVLSLMDWYIASISVMVLVAAEVLVLAWIYGVNRLYDDLEMMIGYRVSPVWKAMWLVVTPLYIIVLLIGGFINFSPVSPGRTGYPPWSQAIGWIIAMCPVIPIPVGMVIAIRKEEGTTFKERLIKATKPRKEWRSSQKEETSHEKKDSHHELDDISSA